MEAERKESILETRNRMFDWHQIEEIAAPKTQMMCIWAKAKMIVTHHAHTNTKYTLNISANQRWINWSSRYIWLSSRPLNNQQNEGEEWEEKKPH